MTNLAVEKQSEDLHDAYCAHETSCKLLKPLTCQACCGLQEGPDLNARIHRSDNELS